MIVLKIGGSLIKEGYEIIEFLEKNLQTSKFGIVVVPGGGPFAETVRRYSNNISTHSAHFMAILAMNQYGIYLSDGKIKTIESFDELTDGLSILLPYKVLRQMDPLNHSWDVTSDTIAAWVAKQLNAKFIKATDVDGIFIEDKMVESIYAKDILGIKTCVDKELPSFLIREKMDCVIVNGRHKSRMLKAIKGENCLGTKLIGREF
ncbi:MAG: amino acid kinase [Cyanobacteriota bacterium]|nr:amino acid kinase [Cyanobacteriota bacterium]